MVGPRRITLSDIADKAGVHITTVSLAMRNNPRLPEGTRRRIRDLAEQLGYRPDPRLQALIAYRGGIITRRHTPTLAYVTGWERGGPGTTPGRCFASALGRAAQLGYKLEHFGLNEAGMSPERLGQILYSRGINGLIVVSPEPDAGGGLRLKWDNFSAVQIDGLPHRPALHNVTNHPGRNLRLALQRVAAAGYQRVGFVVDCGPDEAAGHRWLAGFLSEQQDLSPRKLIPAHVLSLPDPAGRRCPESGTRAEVAGKLLAQWFDRHRPEVLITSASGVPAALARWGLRVPQDVALVDLCLEKADGAVAGVRPNDEAVGALALEILVGQMQRGKFGRPAVPTTTCVAGTWHEGASCPTPRARCGRPARPV